MEKEHINAAWQDKPLPDGLPDGQRPQYIMLRGMYAAFKAGRLTGKQGERIKGGIMAYPAMDADGKAMLLEYFIPLLEADAPACKLLSREYCRVTGGNRPYVKNTILEE